MNVNNLLDKAFDGYNLEKEEIMSLLEIKNNSSEFYKLISYANDLTRSEFNNKAYVFAQIGLNAEPCSINCKFCSMGIDHYAMENKWEKTEKEVMEEVRQIVNKNIDDLFLMTTADYPVSNFLKLGEKVKNIIPKNTRLVANIGDFDYETALKLKEVGFTGVYHINRLREGIDTKANPEDRVKTLDSIQKAGLEIYYCVEPIGPEHSYEEIALEIIRARDYNIGVMAVMRRIGVEGTPLFSKGQISSVELCKIAAVARIASKPTRAMNAHETIQMSLICGVNQLYAEIGANPRDNISTTEKNRGLTVENVIELLKDADYNI